MKKLLLALLAACAIYTPALADCVLRQSDAVELKLGPFVDSTDGNTDETGLTISQADVLIAKCAAAGDCGAYAQKNDSGSCAHDAIGIYECDFNATDTDTVGILEIAIHESGALPVFRSCLVVETALYDADYADASTASRNVSSITDGAIAAADFATGAITATVIAADAIGASELAADAITSSEIADDAIDAGALAASAIGASEIATDAIGSAEVADGAIDAGALATDTITAAKIAADAITNSELATDAIGAAELAADAVGAAELADASIDNATFATTAGPFYALNTVDQGTAQAATATTLQLRSAATFADDELIGATIVITGGTTGVGQARSVTDYVSSTDTATVANWTVTPTGTITYKVFSDPPGSGGAVSISAGGISASSFAAGAIDASAIAADAIGASELATDAIGAAEVAADAIGASELATDAIGAAELASNAIAAAEVADGAIDAATFASGAIDATAIATDAIGAAEIAASAIASAEIADGAIDEATFATTAGSFDALGIVDQGTAQAATGTTLQLRSAAAFADDEIIGATVLITGGSAGVGQSRSITDYVSSTDTATVATWTTTPTGTITYEVFGTSASSGAGSVSIAAGGITASSFASGAIDATAIAADAIGSSELATDAIGAAEIAADAIAASEIATDAIGAAEVAADAIGAAEVADATIDNATFATTAGPLYALNTVDQGTAQAATATTLQLRSAATFADDELIGATVVVTGGSAGVGQARTVTDYVSSTDTATVANWTTTPTGTITYKVFADPPGSGGSVAIAAGGITASSFAAGAIDASAIATDAIGAAEVATDAIGAAEIAASAIGSSELADGGITSAEFGTAAITATVIATDAIGSAEVADGAIDAGALATDTITAAKIAADSITSSELATTAVDEVVDASWDEDMTAHQTQGTSGQVLGDSVADSDSIWSLANTNLNATVSSRASQTSVDTVDDFVDTEISTLTTRLGTPSDLGGGASLAANAADIEAQTDDIGVAGAGLTSRASQTSVDDVPTNAELATALGTADDATLAAIAALPANIRDLVIEDQGGGITLGCALAIAAAYAAGDIATTGANTTFEESSGTETRIAGTTVSAGNRVATITCPTY